MDLPIKGTTVVKTNEIYTETDLLTQKKPTIPLRRSEEVNPLEVHNLKLEEVLQEAKTMYPVQFFKSDQIGILTKKRLVIDKNV